MIKHVKFYINLKFLPMDFNHFKSLFNNVSNNFKIL